jgi:hypothetical protein
MEENKIKIGFCEHTQNEVIQEKFGEEWICIHEDTRDQELESIKHYLVHYDKNTLMNTENGVLYDKTTNKIVGIHNT